MTCMYLDDELIQSRPVQNAAMCRPSFPTLLFPLTILLRLSPPPRCPALVPAVSCVSSVLPATRNAHHGAPESRRICVLFNVLSILKPPPITTIPPARGSRRGQEIGRLPASFFVQATNSRCTEASACNMDAGPDIAQQGMQFPMDVPPTLVKFDPPIFAGLEPSSEANSNRINNNSGNEPRGGGRGGGGKGNNGNHGKTSQLDDMVNSMLPPREWTEETGTWMQYVSKDPATRLAVITLQVSLHMSVKRRLHATMVAQLYLLWTAVVGAQHMKRCHT